MVEGSVDPPSEPWAPGSRTRCFTPQKIFRKLGSLRVQVGRGVVFFVVWLPSLHVMASVRTVASTPSLSTCEEA